jgi:hypothetical protein
LRLDRATPLEAVQDQVELELEPAHVVEAGLGEVLSDTITA